MDENLSDCDIEKAQKILNQCIISTINEQYFTVNKSVKRGLGYYIEDGIEYECPVLGAQKQIAGGGRYKEGYGWAIGVDRIQIAKSIYDGILW